MAEKTRFYTGKVTYKDKTVKEHHVHFSHPLTEEQAIAQITAIPPFGDDAVSVHLEPVKETMPTESTFKATSSNTPPLPPA